MSVKHLVVSGQSLFINRHSLLIDALRTDNMTVEPLIAGDSFKKTPAGLLTTIFYKLRYGRSGDPSEWHHRLHKSRLAFDIKSKDLNQRIMGLAKKPDLVLHMMCVFAPDPKVTSIPYVLMLDYTASMAIRNWPVWVPFAGDAAKDEWFAAERKAYEQASHIFTFSRTTRDSLVDDYGIPSAKITPVGSAGDYTEPYAGEKSFGSKKILFNGSEWKRKGGDIALREFQKVRSKIDDATLVVIGTDMSTTNPGVKNLGVISSRDEMKKLMLDSDVVFSPSRCDPFPTFLIEAMNLGVPGIVPPRDGMPEIVVDGVTGLVANDDDLGAAIVKLLGDPAQLRKFSDAGRKKVAGELSWPVVAGKIHAVIDRM